MPNHVIFFSRSFKQFERAATSSMWQGSSWTFQNRLRKWTFDRCGRLHLYDRWRNGWRRIISSGLYILFNFHFATSVFQCFFLGWRFQLEILAPQYWKDKMGQKESLQVVRCSHVAIRICALVESFFKLGASWYLLILCCRSSSSVSCIVFSILFLKLLNVSVLLLFLSRLFKLTLSCCSRWLFSSSCSLMPSSTAFRQPNTLWSFILICWRFPTAAWTFFLHSSNSFCRSRPSTALFDGIWVV